MAHLELVVWSCRPHIECFAQPLVSVSSTWHGLSKKVREPGFFVARLGGGSFAKQTTKPMAAPQKSNMSPLWQWHKYTPKPVDQFGGWRLEDNCSFHNIHIYMVLLTFFDTTHFFSNKKCVKFFVQQPRCLMFFGAVPITTDMFYSFKNLGPLIFFRCFLQPGGIAKQKPKEEEKGSEFKETEIVYALSLGAQGEGCVSNTG